MKSLEVVLVGSGHVAHHLAARLAACGITFTLHARDSEHAFALAAHYQLTLRESVNPQWVLFAIRDTDLPEVIQQYHQQHPEWHNACWLHTSGSQPIDILPTQQRGVLYPLQTFHRDKPNLDWSTVPVFLESNSPETGRKLENLAKILSGNVQNLDSTGRLQLHLSAVIACNFSNHLYNLAARLMEAHGLKFELLKPLLEETLNKALQLGPAQAQTGPAIRRDQPIMDKHLALLAHHPEIAELYRLISHGIAEGKG